MLNHATERTATHANPQLAILEEDSHAGIGQFCTEHTASHAKTEALQQSTLEKQGKAYTRYQ